MVRMWIHHPDLDSISGLPPKFNRDFFVHGYINDKIYRLLSPEI